RAVGAGHAVDLLLPVRARGVARRARAPGVPRPTERPAHDRGAARRSGVLLQRRAPGPLRAPGVHRELPDRGRGPGRGPGRGRGDRRRARRRAPPRRLARMSPPLTFGLLGSGEFLPWSEEVDRWLLERATGDGRVL